MISEQHRFILIRIVAFMCVLINLCCVRLNKCSLFSNEHNMMASIKFNFYDVGTLSYWTSFAYRN